jgi:hypothetical protein
MDWAIAPASLRTACGQYRSQPGPDVVALGGEVGTPMTQRANGYDIQLVVGAIFRKRNDVMRFKVDNEALLSSQFKSTRDPLHQAFNGFDEDAPNCDHGVHQRRQAMLRRHGR